MHGDGYLAVPKRASDNVVGPSIRSEITQAGHTTYTFGALRKKN